MKTCVHAWVPGPRGVPQRLAKAPLRMLPSARLNSVGTPNQVFRGSIAPPARPLSTLQRCPHEHRRMTQGHRGSLLLRCRELSSPISMPVYPGASQTRPRPLRQWRPPPPSPTTAASSSERRFGQPMVAGGVSVWLCSNLPNPPAGTPPCPPPPATVTGTIDAADVVGPTAQGIAPGEIGELMRAIRAGVTYAKSTARSSRAARSAGRCAPAEEAANAATAEAERRSGGWSRLPTAPRRRRSDRGPAARTAHECQNVGPRRE